VTVIGQIVDTVFPATDKNGLSQLYLTIHKTDSPEHNRGADKPNQRHNIHVKDDGTFRIENVPNGIFEIHGVIQEAAPGNVYHNTVIAKVNYKFTVNGSSSENEMDKVIDIGKFPLKFTTFVKVGDKAPLFEVKSVKDDMLKLSDYRGKYVLLQFWSTRCVPCVAEIP